MQRLYCIQQLDCSQFVCRVKRLAALCANYDGVIAAGIYMTLKTPGSSSGSAAASEGEALHDMVSSDQLAAGAGAGDSTGEAAVDEAKDAALAGGGATAAITRRLQSIGRNGGSSSGGSGSGGQPVESDSSVRGGSRLDGSWQLARGVLQADDAAADPGAVVEQAVHKLNRLHAKMEAEGAITARRHAQSCLGHQVLEWRHAPDCTLALIAAPELAPPCKSLSRETSRHTCVNPVDHCKVVT